jgi:hypothetical protein
MSGLANCWGAWNSGERTRPRVLAKAPSPSRTFLEGNESEKMQKKKAFFGGGAATSARGRVRFSEFCAALKICDDERHLSRLLRKTKTPGTLTVLPAFEILTAIP